MAVIEYDSYKQKLGGLKDTFENLYKALDIDAARFEIKRLEAEAEEEGFWNDLARSQACHTEAAEALSDISAPGGSFLNR